MRLQQILKVLKISEKEANLKHSIYFSESAHKKTLTDHNHQLATLTSAHDQQLKELILSTTETIHKGSSVTMEVTYLLGRNYPKSHKVLV